MADPVVFSRKKTSIMWDPATEVNQNKEVHVKDLTSDVITSEDSELLWPDLSKYPLTYMEASKYKGPIVEGWPPGRNRSLDQYIRPYEDTFTMRPVWPDFQYE